jgi:hypothetical protein
MWYAAAYCEAAKFTESCLAADMEEERPGEDKGISLGNCSW